MGLPYQKQLDYKYNKVKNILNNYASLNLEPTIKESNIYNYRNKITLQVNNGNIGLYTSNSHDLIQIDKCYLISNNMNNIIPLIKELDLSNINQIIIRESTNQLMLKFIGKINISTLINKLSSKVDSIYLNEELIYGTPTITETLDKYKFLISPDSFFQVNKNQTINLYNQVKNYLGPNNNEVLD